VKKRREDEELRALRGADREPDAEPEAQPTPEPTAEIEIDAAESRWDPWLVALARMEEEQSEPRAN